MSDEPLTDAELDEMARLLDEATRTDWIVREMDDGVREHRQLGTGDYREAFTSAARTFVPKAIAELRDRRTVEPVSNVRLLNELLMVLGRYCGERLYECEDLHAEIDTLTRERDEARAQRDDLHDTMHGDMPYVACTEVRRALVETQDKLCAEIEQLRRFAVHPSDCNRWPGGSDTRDPASCTCGLAALLPGGGGQVWPSPGKGKRE